MKKLIVLASVLIFTGHAWADDVAKDSFLMSKEDLAKVMVQCESWDSTNETPAETQRRELSAMSLAGGADDTAIEAIQNLSDNEVTSQLQTYLTAIKDLPTAVVETLSADANPCALDDAERVSLLAYTGSLYVELDHPEDPQYKPIAKSLAIFQKTLNIALSKIRPFVGHTESGLTMTASQINNFQTGRVIKFDTYISSSLSKAFPSNVLLQIYSRTGKYIAPYSGMPEENEVLFVPGASFEVISNSFDSSYAEATEFGQPIQGRHVIKLREQ